MKFIVFLVLGYALTAAADMPCADKKGGWRTACLQEAAQQADESATKTYVDMQSQIKDLTVVSPAYNQQLKTLLRKNELDFIKYSESYCDMQNVISVEDTELNKILSCQIKSFQLREAELKSIIETIIKRQAKK